MVRHALETSRDKYAFYAQEHRNKCNEEKAKVNENMETVCAVAIEDVLDCLNFLTNINTSIHELKVAAVRAAEPLEAMIMVGTHYKHSQKMQNGIHIGVNAVREVLAKWDDAK
jgi:hypothetical protein